MSHLRMTEEQLAARAKKLDTLQQSKGAPPAKIKQKKVAVRVPSEHEEQCKVIQWCNADPIAKHIFAIPNGSHKSPAAAAKFKREGLRSGVPDLFLPVSRDDYHGMFIEMKRVRFNLTSDAQTSWLLQLSRNGYFVRICEGADVAIAAIKKYLGEK